MADEETQALSPSQAILMKTHLFNYHLPQERIALYPPAQREQSRLLVCHAQEQQLVHTSMAQLPTLVTAGDLLILNNSCVIKARLFGCKPTGGQVEVFIETVRDAQTAYAFLQSNKPCRAGMNIICAHPTENATLVVKLNEKIQQRWLVTLNLPVFDALESFGVVPLPPYINRNADTIDESRYQTVFAAQAHKGSVAAPTAGLHFSEQLLNRLQQQGVNQAYVTLHVGAGTFKPVQSEDVEAHTMHTERYSITQETVDAIKRTKAQGGRVIAVGTTSLRCLESMMAQFGRPQATSGETDAFIYPPYQFQLIDGLLTNFHTPQSTLLMLVAAFIHHKSDLDVGAAIAYTLDIYNQSIAAKYRFLSYGDAQLIL